MENSGSLTVMNPFSELTIIVPIHNHMNRSHKLLSWIESKELLVSQIILVHDTSDNQPLTIIKTLVSTIGSIEIVEGNFAAPGLARNAGLELANRKWITFWDFDDLPQLDGFTRFFEKTVMSDAEIGIGRFEVASTSSGEVLSDSLFFDDLENAVSDLMVNPGIWRWVFQRDLIGSTRFPKNRIGEDQIFLAKIGGHNKKIFFSNEIIYHYFIGDPNQATLSELNTLELLAVAEELVSLSKSSIGHSKRYCQVAALRCSGSYLRRSRATKTKINYIRCGLISVHLLLQQPLGFHTLCRQAFKSRTIL